MKVKVLYGTFINGIEYSKDDVFEIEDAQQLIKRKIVEEFKEEKLPFPVEVTPREEVLKQTINKRVKK